MNKNDKNHFEFVQISRLCFLCGIKQFDPS